MTTKQHIASQVMTLRETTGLNLFADFASAYGGYRLVEVDTTYGAHYECFGQSSRAARMSAKVFDLYLSGLIGGLTFKK